ncbi:MAG: Flp pilus assembly protein CpaB [Candidatus Odyssella sp.]|nr:Flp pilus assembly protein CpaB [Candidatus Odyssella sp.]
MRKGFLIFAVIAFALTGGTIYFVNTWMKAERSRLAAAQQKKVEEPRESGVFVLVAAKDLPAGHIITVSDLRWQSWPDKSVPQQYVVKKDAASTDIPASYVGTVVRRGIVASGPITGDNLIKLGDRGFLAAVLKPGHRAIAVRIDESTGVAGLIYPGDRVDVILTHEVGVKKEGERDSENRVRVSETILSNVRVIAIDQSLEDLKAQKGVAARSPKTATLEVTPQQAEIITVATRMGTLTLTLQSLACAGGEAQSASTGDAPNCADAQSAMPEEPARGKTFTADHDVSRMRRRENADTTEVYVLRGSEKDSQKDNSVTVKLPPGSKVQQ